MVLPRLLTALVLAPVFLWVLYLGSLPFLAFMVVLVLLALWEFHGMAEAGGYATQSGWGIAAGLVLVAAMAFPGVRPSLPFSAQAPAFVLFLGVLALTLREMVRRDKSLSMLRLGTSLLGILIVAWPLGHLILLRELRGTDNPEAYHLGRNAALFLVALVWSQDTAAWAVGKAIGKRRLAPQISPGKSWEGAAGGLAAAVLTALVLREVWLRDTFSRPEVLGLGAALGVLGQVSDLAESLMKRCFGVKDSSDLLPGHGGILDRFDSFLFTAPFFYFYLVMTA
jgi:phosphatidate cytidylyltransferase